MTVGASSRWSAQQVNANVGQGAVVRPSDVAWFATDYEGVWFAPFEADEGVQCHPVTMLTRMGPGSFFPLHGHPGGEEVLVLEGVFEDDTGAYPAGSYLLNPEGFEHRPFTRDGCVTFVKLRQHGGAGRTQLRASFRLGSVPPTSGVELVPLYAQPGFGERVHAERWAPGSTRGPFLQEQVMEALVVEGTWCSEGDTYETGTWLRFPPGLVPASSSPDGCTLYVKTFPADADRFIVDPGFRHPDGAPPT